MKGRKLAAALDERRDAYISLSVGKHKQHVPGSRNANKGYGGKANGGRRG